VSRRRKLRSQDRLLLLILVALAPAWLSAMLLIWHWEAEAITRWTLFVIISAWALGGALAARRRFVQPLQSLANLLEALREDDYSLRGRNVDPRDAVGEVMVEVNALGRMLHGQRLDALEAGMLLEKVVAEVDMAVFAFDAERRLQLVNRAGESLLAAEAEQLLGRDAAGLGLGSMLDEPPGRIVSHVFPGGSGRWEIRRRGFREGGRPHELLVISELSRALREEERQAWQRLVRVIGHELNNSLAPIKSTAGTLMRLVGREPLPADWREDAQSGLGLIHDRADALGRFIGAYARLARLPAPTLRPVDFPGLLSRVAALHGGLARLEAGPPVTMEADADQLEQVLINLAKNAVEATGESGGVRARWRVEDEWLEIEIEDDGPGLARTDNLWVPFFTTKPGGTGIGLLLSRTIVENHGGALSLENRADGPGCVARVRLPLKAEHLRSGAAIDRV
jgi:two-component system, NtrC family, nitrogen regulation sensor histidine kinase NtrY